MNASTFEGFGLSAVADLPAVAARKVVAVGSPLADIGQEIAGFAAGNFGLWPAGCGPN